jgi:hypothetical protein
MIWRDFRITSSRSSCYDSFKQVLIGIRDNFCGTIMLVELCIRHLVTSDAVTSSAIRAVSTFNFQCRSVRNVEMRGL